MCWEGGSLGKYPRVRIGIVFVFTNQEGLSPIIMAEAVVSCGGDGVDDLQSACAQLETVAVSSADSERSVESTAAGDSGDSNRPQRDSPDHDSDEDSSSADSDFSEYEGKKLASKLVVVSHNTYSTSP